MLLYIDFFPIDIVQFYSYKRLHVSTTDMDMPLKHTYSFGGSSTFWRILNKIPLAGRSNKNRVKESENKMEGNQDECKT